MSQRDTITNDVTIQVATINGTGSQSSNLILTKSLFRMGIPVGPKNMFPSNIMGLPTWYTMRVSRDGYLARKRQVNVLVALNPNTWRQDVLNVEPGGAIVYEAAFGDAALAGVDPSIARYPVPIDRLADEKIENARLRRLLKNLIYVGVLAELLGLEIDTVEDTIRSFFASKPKAIDANIEAMRIGLDYAREHLQKTDPYRVERMDRTGGKILIEGNTASALGCVFGGCTVVAWYPITPSSSLVESTIEYFERFRKDADGKNKYAVVQCEDEISSIGMVVGAAWCGARSMTSTSGPGISLMGEIIGLSYYAEVPAVLFNVQRVGPSTGLPTRTAQGDISQVAHASQGDTKHVMLWPADPTECFEFAQRSFDLAERLQGPIFVMLDLDLGMNLWQSEPFDHPAAPFDRGKVLTDDDLAKMESYGRYADVDGDAIPYRTLPGIKDPKGVFFTRGSGHDENARYTESEVVYERMIDRLARKYDTARGLVPAPVEDRVEGATIGLIAFGSTDLCMREARDQLLTHGLKTSYHRLRAVPFHPSTFEFVDACERVYVIEQNRDGQMYDLLRLEMTPEQFARVRSVRHYNGMPVDAQSVVDDLLAHERKQEEAVHV